MPTCEGCWFQGDGAKRCKTCSRQYTDQFKEKPKLTEAQFLEQLKALRTLGTLPNVLAKISELKV